MASREEGERNCQLCYGNYGLCVLFQLIFRKVSDVKKERELAERRKNDPALNHTQDHLVRKLFSKFKRGPVGPGSEAVIAKAGDLERGLPDGHVITDNGIPPGSSSNGDNNGLMMSGPSPSHTLAPTSNGTSGGPAKGRGDSLEVVRDVGVKRPSIGSSSALSGWGRFRKVVSRDPDDDSDKGDDESKDSSDQSRSDRASAKAASKLAKSPEFKEIVKNMTDFKADIKQEMKVMNDKIDKMETLMTDFICKLNAALPKAQEEAAHVEHHVEESDKGRRGRGRRHGKSRSRDRKGHRTASSGNEDLDDDSGGGGGGSAAHLKFLKGQKEEYL